MTLSKKICLLGAPGVGKTSLVRRFVKGIFSDRYLTTIGVKIDKKTVRIGERESLQLIIWDVSGEDEFSPFRDSYVRGAAGYLLVVDGTEQASLDVALHLRERADAVAGAVPFVLAINKNDLADLLVVADGELEGFVRQGWRVTRTSAKTGDGVEEMFLSLGRAIAHAEGKAATAIAAR